MIEIRGKKDDALEAVAVALTSFDNTHPNAKISTYRQNSVSIRIRIVDESFNGISRGDRHDLIWEILEIMPEEYLCDVTLLILLTPEETATSFANMEFDHPVPSRL